MAVFIKIEKEFESIYNLFAERMFIICYNKTNDKEISKEIVQDIFKSLWERKDHLVINGPIKHYLFRAAKLEVIDYFRKCARAPKNIELSLEDTYSLSANTTEDELYHNELQYKIDKLISKMPDRCQEVFKLSRENGLTNKEIAENLLISTKTVEAHITKALHFLRSNLVEYSL